MPEHASDTQCLIRGEIEAPYSAKYYQYSPDIRFEKRILGFILPTLPVKYVLPRRLNMRSLVYFIFPHYLQAEVIFVRASAAQASCTIYIPMSIHISTVIERCDDG